MELLLDLNSVADYRTFLRVKSLPAYRFDGRRAWFPDEYAALVGADAPQTPDAGYAPSPGLFDYQRDIAALAIRRRAERVRARAARDLFNAGAET